MEDGPLGPGEVRVWLARPGAWPRGLAPEALLDDADRDAVARLRAAGARRARATARALLRAALSHAVAGAVAPADWRFRRPGGRPEVEAPEAGCHLAVSASHTEGLVACAVSRAGAVGVDVEWTGRRLRPLALAERFFAPAERDALRALPEPERPAHFLALWTAKEAFAKARGEGLAATGLARIRVAGVGSGAPRLAPDAALGEPAAAWHLHLQAPDAEHLLAVAVRCGPARPRLRVAHAAQLPSR